MSESQNVDVVKKASDWIKEILADRQKRVAIKRASSLKAFKDSWYVASLLGRIHVPHSDQLLTALWGTATAKDVCNGSLAVLSRKNGLKERHWQKLTSTRDREEAARQVRRIIRQLPAAPTDDVIEKLFYWGPRARRDWAVAWFKQEWDGSDDS